jgi:ComF family protein
MQLTALSRIGRLALDLLYPPLCALCGRSGALLCDACAESLPVAAGRRCSRCWLPQVRDECRACDAFPLVVTALRSAYRYEGPARELVHRFKFGDISSLSEVMAPSMAALLDWPVDVVVPVPLMGSRQRERGYNQAALLAKGVAVRLELPLSPALKRLKSGAPQARTASAAERRRLVQGAFAARTPAAVEGRRVLLVDDVATTGATLDACARPLLASGATEVSAVTFARED